MSGVAHQSDRSVNPGIDGVAVDHRVLINVFGGTQQCRDIQPVVGPAVKVMNKVRQFGGFVPPGLALFRIILGYFRDPVDICMALRIGLGNRVHDQTLAMGAQADEG